MKRDRIQKAWLAAAGALATFFLMDRAGMLYLGTPGTFTDKLLAAMSVVPAVLRRPFAFSAAPVCLAWGVGGAVFIALLYVYFVLGRRPTRPGAEHGSAAWGDADTIKPLIDPVPENNIILTQTEQLSMSSRMPRTKLDDFNRNKHVLILGGSGSGKTRFHVKPNILQMNCNYVITDPKGALLEECGYALAKNGYKIKVFNLVDRQHSDHYNPFAYLHNEDDILKIAKNLIANMKDDPRARPANDPIWEEGMTGLIEALFSYVLFELSPSQQNMTSVMELFRLLEVKEDVANYVSPLDILFNDLAAEKPDAFAVKQYQIYKMAAPKTAQSINVSLGLRLSAFNIPSIANLVEDDTLELMDFTSDQKVALFVVLPDTTKAFNFLAAVLYQQLFDLLVLAADSRPEKRLIRHCRFLLDEFANLGKIPDFEILIATIRSREISVTIVLQSLSQLKSQYEHDWGTIVDNCDSFLFLGGSSNIETLEYISKLLGKATIEVLGTSEMRGSQGSFTKSYQLVGRELMLPDEIRRLRRGECLLVISGLAPFKSRKYDLLAHPNYHLLADANVENQFTFQRRAEYAAQQFLSNVSDVQTIQLPELNDL